MASPLEKSRELAVLIVIQNTDCPLLLLLDNVQYQGGGQEVKGSKGLEGYKQEGRGSDPVKYQCQ